MSSVDNRCDLVIGGDFDPGRGGAPRPASQKSSGRNDVLLQIGFCLPQGANILLVLDYDPAYSGEIEAAVNAPISLMMVKQANLFTLSTAPTNLFLADNLLKSVSPDHPARHEKSI